LHRTRFSDLLAVADDSVRAAEDEVPAHHDVGFGSTAQGPSRPWNAGDNGGSQKERQNEELLGHTQFLQKCCG